MQIPNLMLFYVKNPLDSALFYEKIFASNPVAAHPSYVAFSFENGFHFSLWSTQATNFVSDGTGHRSELAFMLHDEQTLHDTYKRWREHGVPLEQDLHEAVFGLTFVALDPDGHRIRVCLFDK